MDGERELPLNERFSDDGARPERSVAPAGQSAAAQPPAERVGRPDQTRDDTDVGWGEVPEPADAHDRWLLEQRPPHWD